MGVFYENPEQARKKISNTIINILAVAEIKKDHVSLRWPEEQAKQKFEPNLKPKIGWTETPHMKVLEQKRDPNFPKVEKIGAPEV